MSHPIIYLADQALRKTGTAANLFKKFCMINFTSRENRQEIVKTIRSEIEAMGGMSQTRFADFLTPEDDSTVLDDALTHKGNTVYRSETTVSGIKADIAKSGVQKHIRRGNVDLAKYYAAQLDLFRFMTGGKKVFTNFINRLKIIFMEDIGIACPQTMIATDRCFAQLRKDTKTQGASSNPNAEVGILSPALMELIEILANSPKSRFYSHIKAVGRNRKRSGYPDEISDLISKEYSEETVKKITSRLENTKSEVLTNFMKAMLCKDSRVWDFIEPILAVSSKDEMVSVLGISKPVRVKTIRSDRKSTRPGFVIFDILNDFAQTDFERQTLAICFDWYYTLKCKEQFLCCMHAAYTIIFSSEIDKIPGVTESLKYSPTKTDISGYHDTVFVKSKKVDWYIADMHTSYGRMNGRDKTDFGLEGSLVCYNTTKDFSCRVVDYKKKIVKTKKIVPSSEVIYRNEKFRDGGEILETDEFVLKARAQLICSGQRPDSYFAQTITATPDGKGNAGTNVVVKGPYLNYSEIARSYNILTILRLFQQVNTYDVSLKYLIPNMFDDTPLGTRTKIVANQGYYFLVMKDLFGKGEYPVKTKSSKLWKDTTVVDFDKVYGEKYGLLDPENMTIEAQKSSLYQLCIRYVFGIGDYASRNFVRVKSKVYNVDVENFSTDSKKITKMKQSNKQVLLDVYNKHKSEFKSVFESWLEEDKKWEGDTGRWYIIENVLGVNVDSFKDRISELIDSVETMFK